MLIMGITGTCKDMKKKVGATISLLVLYFANSIPIQSLRFEALCGSYLNSIVMAKKGLLKVSHKLIV